jgi:hypothetical protein
MTKDILLVAAGLGIIGLGVIVGSGLGKDCVAFLHRFPFMDRFLHRRRMSPLTFAAILLCASAGITAGAAMPRNGPWWMLARIAVIVVLALGAVALYRSDSHAPAR